MECERNRQSVLTDGKPTRPMRACPTCVRGALRSNSGVVRMVCVFRGKEKRTLVTSKPRPLPPPEEDGVSCSRRSFASLDLSTARWPSVALFFCIPSCTARSFVEARPLHSSVPHEQRKEKEKGCAPASSLFHSLSPLSSLRCPPYLTFTQCIHLTNLSNTQPTYTHEVHKK